MTSLISCLTLKLSLEIFGNLRKFSENVKKLFCGLQTSLGETSKPLERLVDNLEKVVKNHCFIFKYNASDECRSFHLQDDSPTSQFAYT